MIFSMVGTSSWDFSRFVKMMDDVGSNISEEIIIQIAHCDYEPKNIKWFRFISPNNIQELIRCSRLLVTHAGTGSFIDAAMNKKPLIVVPRDPLFNELIDDHQMITANFLNKYYGVKIANNRDELMKMIMTEIEPIVFSESRELMINKLKKIIMEQNHE